MPDTPARSIQVLPPEEARKIAAGEVIERPASIVRELLDNAIDAGAARIDVLLEEGGVKLTEVRDDGCGMSAGDLAIASLTHATSKIRSLDDLCSVRSLGFRGEALAACAAVGVLEIITSTGASDTGGTSDAGGGGAWRLAVSPRQPGAGADGPHAVESAQRVRGTTVRVRRLFDAIPARKRFLKRDGSEAALCRQILIDKALAFPEISFRFFVDGKLKLVLPQARTKKERFCAAVLDGAHAEFLHEINATGAGFTAGIVVGGPELARTDRRRQYVFANGRRINDYALQQALEFGCQLWFPNNAHPTGAIYLEIDPELADFNIHPAKREARFTCGAAIHHAITTTLTHFVRAASGAAANIAAALSDDEDDPAPPVRAAALWEEPPADGGYSSGIRTWAQVQAENGYGDDSRARAEPRAAGEYDGASDGGRARPWPPAYSPVGAPTGEYMPETNLRFYGYLFGFFIAVADGDHFYLIDQHAAHERLLYEKFLAAPVARQPLLVPLPFTTDCAEDDDFLAAKQPELERLGVVVRKAGGGSSGGWVLEELPLLWRLSDSATIRALLDLRTAGESMACRWAATIACHAAVTEGDLLDDRSALQLAHDAIQLHVQRCPHGRPILKMISKTELLKAVNRL